MTDSATTDPDRVPRPVWWLVFFFIPIAAAAVFWSIPHHQDDLEARAEQALASAGFDDVDVDVEGRDAVLQGSVPTDADIRLVEDLVFNVRGVRSVDNSALAFLTVAPASAPSEATTTTTASVVAFVTLAYDGTTAILNGTVPDESSVAALDAAAAGQFGEDNVDTQVGVDALAGTPSWLGVWPAVVASLSGLEAGTLTVDDTGIVIEGLVADAAAADTIESALAASSGLPVDSELAVLGAASLSVEVADGTASLTGVLPSEVDVDMVVAAASEQYDVVNNDLAVGPVGHPDWLALVPDLFAATGGWNQWTFAVGADAARFAGFAPDGLALASLQNGLLTRLGVGPAGFTAELDPTAVASDLTALLEGTATFDPGETTLSAEATALLDQVIAILSANPSTVVIVEGHTDDQGGAAGNLALSQARAEAVVDYLVAGGIDEQRLSAVGYGEERPIADNDTSQGRALNRRIEFVVETAGGG